MPAGGGCIVRIEHPREILRENLVMYGAEEIALVELIEIEVIRRPRFP